MGSAKTQQLGENDEAKINDQVLDINNHQFVTKHKIEFARQKLSFHISDGIIFSCAQT